MVIALYTRRKIEETVDFETLNQFLSLQKQLSENDRHFYKCIHAAHHKEH